MLCWSSPEEIHHVQGKRNPSKTVGTERGHQRADRLKPQLQTTSEDEDKAKEKSYVGIYISSITLMKLWEM